MPSGVCCVEKGLTDPEMVAVMIGDVSASMPGLQQLKRSQKAAKKGPKSA